MSMTIQSSVKDKILDTSSETSKVENGNDEGGSSNEMEARSINVLGTYPERNAAESVSDAIRFEYCLASSSWIDKWKTHDKEVYDIREAQAARDRQKSYADNSCMPAMRTLCGQAKLLAVRYLVKVSWNSKTRFPKRGETVDNRCLSRRFDNQSIERDRLIGIGFVLDFVEFILFTFSDKEMILVIEAVSR
ncbi:hypothetical protein Tco_1262566 [Tanacetum coccineum]